MDRYDRGEGRYDRDEPRGGSGGTERGDFPWSDSSGGDQPAQVWEEAPAGRISDSGPAGAPAGRRVQQGNGLAIAGFVCSIVMWIPIPFLNLVLWLLAVTFSSIGLSRARRLGLPHKGLAIAGLCLSLIGSVSVILVFLVFFGALATSA